MVTDSKYRLKAGIAVAGDGLMVLAAYLLCYYVRSVSTFPLGSDLIPLTRFSRLPHYWAVLVLSQFVWLYLWGLYDEIWTRSPGDLVLSVWTGVTLQTLFLGMFYGFASQAMYPRTVFPLFWVLNTGLTAIWRLFLGVVFRDRRRRSLLIVGLNESSEKLIHILDDQPSLGLDVAGVVASGQSGEVPPGAPPPETFGGKPVLGSVEQIDEILDRSGADEVVMTSGIAWQDHLVDALGKAQRPGIRLSLMPGVYEILIGKAGHLRIRDLPLIEVAGDPSPASRMVVKRALDLFLATLLLVLLGPLMLFVAVYVKLFSPGPVFYTQERVGKDGRIFRVIKFRTMVPDAEQESGAVLSVEDDPRVTAVGRLLRKTRLDELPQLFNVLWGEMSFLGPRPERPVFVAEYEKSMPGYSQRHKVKPGITGLAQVSGFYDTDTANKLKYDLYYIHNYSLWLDLTILVATAKTMITRRGL